MCFTAYRQLESNGKNGRHIGCVSMETGGSTKNMDRKNGKTKGNPRVGEKRENGQRLERFGRTSPPTCLAWMTLTTTGAQSEHTHPTPPLDHSKMRAILRGWEWGPTFMATKLICCPHYNGNSTGITLKAPIELIQILQRCYRFKLIQIISM